MYRAIADYTKTTKYEINLLAGDQVEIVEKNQNGEKVIWTQKFCMNARNRSKRERLCFCSPGWWFCQMDSKRGWVPASYLEPLDGPEESEEADPDYEGKLSRCFLYWANKHESQRDGVDLQASCLSPLRPTRRSRRMRSLWI